MNNLSNLRIKNGLANSAKSRWLAGLCFDGVNDYISFTEMLVDKILLYMTVYDEVNFSFIADNRDLIGGEMYVTTTNTGLIQFVGCYVSIDGISLQSGDAMTFDAPILMEITTESPVPLTKMFVRNSFDFFAKVKAYNVQMYNNGSLVANYVRKADYGLSYLPDHSGNGNDGTINGATWCGKPLENQIWNDSDVWNDSETWND